MVDDRRKLALAESGGCSLYVSPIDGSENPRVCSQLRTMIIHLKTCFYPMQYFQLLFDNMPIILERDKFVGRMEIHNIYSFRTLLSFLVRCSPSLNVCNKILNSLWSMLIIIIYLNQVKGRNQFVQPSLVFIEKV